MTTMAFDLAPGSSETTSEARLPIIPKAASTRPVSPSPPEIGLADASSSTTIQSPASKGGLEQARDGRDTAGSSETPSAAAAHEGAHNVDDALSPHGRHRGMSRARAILIIATLSGVGFLNTMGSGILTVSLPTMAGDVGLDESLLLWPASVYSLAAGCTLLFFGAVGDILGARRVWLAGACLYSVFTLGVGRNATGPQLIAFRSALGVSVAMCLPTAVSLTTNGFGAGRWRNMAFAMQGMAQPIGYSTGLVLGGVFTETAGWRVGFYISGAVSATIAACAVAVLPSPPPESSGGLASLATRLARDVDWSGTLTLSSSMGLLSYVFSVASRDRDGLVAAQNLVLFFAAVLVLPPCFALWVGRQERLGRPALIPNSLWRNVSFSSTCAAVFLAWAVFNSFQYSSALSFERIERVSALQTSLRFLPMVIVGASTNIATGYLVEKIDVKWLVVVSAFLSAFSPLIMALSTPDQGYWKGPFFAMVLSPLHPDVLFTVSNLIISHAYVGKSQSLAGAVFNAVAQVGNSVGLGVTAVVSSAVARSRRSHDVGDPVHVDADALLAGYRASFWLMFACAALVVPITFFGLKKGGKVGAVR